MSFTIAVTLHLGYQNLWGFFEPYINMFLNHYPNAYLLFSYQQDSPLIKELRERYKRASFFLVKKGNDIGGQLIMFNHLMKVEPQPEVVFVLHTKGDDKWRNNLVNSIAGSEKILESVINLFQRNPHVGMIGWYKNHYRMDTFNRGILEEICEREFGIDKQKIYSFSFIAGTIFAVRWSIYKKAFTGKDLVEYYNQLELGHIKNHLRPTYTHSWERIFGILVEEAGYKIVGI